MKLEEKKTVFFDVYRITHDEIEKRKYPLLQRKIRQRAEEMFTEDGLNRIYWEDRYCPGASVTISVTEDEVIHDILSDNLLGWVGWLDEISDISIERHTKGVAPDETLDYVLVSCSYEKT